MERVYSKPVWLFFISCKKKNVRAKTPLLKLITKVKKIKHLPKENQKSTI